VALLARTLAGSSRCHRARSPARAPQTPACWPDPTLLDRWLLPSFLQRPRRCEPRTDLEYPRSTPEPLAARPHLESEDPRMVVAAIEGRSLRTSRSPLPGSAIALPDPASPDFPEPFARRDLPDSAGSPAAGAPRTTAGSGSWTCSPRLGHLPTSQLLICALVLADGVVRNFPFRILRRRALSAARLSRLCLPVMCPQSARALIPCQNSAQPKACPWARCGSGLFFACQKLG